MALRFAVFLFCRASQCLPPADGQSTFPRRNLTKTYFTSELYSPSPPTTAWGLVFCTTQSEYLYKYFIFLGQIFNREFNKTEMAETNGNGFGSKHCWELRWEALERRLRASGVLITDRMDIIRRCNKPATCRSGKRGLQQWLLQGDLLKELMHQPCPVINAQNAAMFIPQFWYPNSPEVINWTKLKDQAPQQKTDMWI